MRFGSKARKMLSGENIELDETSRVIQEGGINVPRLKGVSDSLYNKYGVSGNVEHRPEERQKMFDEMRANVAQIGIRTTAAFLGMKQIQDQYQYEKIPAFQTAARVGSEFSQKIMEAMQTREQMRLEYTQIASNIIQASAVAIQAGRFAFATSKAIREAGKLGGLAARAGKWARRLRGVATAVRGLRRIRNAIAAALAASGAGSILSVLGTIATEVAFYAAPKIAESLVDAFFTGRFNEQFQNVLAGKMIDSSQLARFYESTRFIPGYSFENLEDLQSRTRRYGSTTEGLLRTLGSVETGIRGADINGYAERIFLESRISGVDEGLTSSIFTSLGNIGGGSKPVQDANLEFQKFFAAVSSKANDSAAEIGLVKELTSFAESYSFGYKMVTDVTNLANIQGFMNRAGTGDMLTTAPTQNLVRGLDEALLGAAGATNIAMLRFNAMYGIGMDESLRGITSDSSTLNKFLGGLVSEIGISSSGLTEDSSIRMYRLLNSMGVDSDTTQIIMRIMPGYLRGERVHNIEGEAPFEDVRNNYDITSDMLDYFSKVSDDDLRSLEINIENTTTIIENLKETTAAYVDFTLNVVDKYAQLAVLAADSIRAVNMEKALRVSDALHAAGAFASSGGSIGTGPRISSDRLSAALSAAGHTASSGSSRGSVSTSNSTPRGGSLLNESAISEFISNNPNYRHVVNSARELGVRPEDLAALIGFETNYSFSPSEQRNPYSSATGLIQFVENTASWLGTSTDELKNMSFEEQMNYVVEYLRRFGVGTEHNSIVDMYIAILQPASLGKDVIISDPDKVAKNPILDVDDSGTITRSDLEARFGVRPRTITINLETIDVDVIEFGDALFNRLTTGGAE